MFTTFISRHAPGEEPAAPGGRTGAGLGVLDALDHVAAELDTDAASVALAWASSHATITAPLAAATSTDQLDQLFAAAALRLREDQVERLDEASASFA